MMLSTISRQPRVGLCCCAHPADSSPAKKMTAEVIYELRIGTFTPQGTFTAPAVTRCAVSSS
jgi:hypothetical protein